MIGSGPVQSFSFAFAAFAALVAFEPRGVEAGFVVPAPGVGNSAESGELRALAGRSAPTLPGDRGPDLAKRASRMLQAPSTDGWLAEADSNAASMSWMDETRGTIDLRHFLDDGGLSRSEMGLGGFRVEIQAVSAPSSAVLLGIGIVGLAGFQLRRRRDG